MGIFSGGGGDSAATLPHSKCVLCCRVCCAFEGWTNVPRSTAESASSGLGAVLCRGRRPWNIAGRRGLHSGDNTLRADPTSGTVFKLHTLSIKALLGEKNEPVVVRGLEWTRLDWAGLMENGPFIFDHCAAVLSKRNCPFSQYAYNKLKRQKNII